MTINGTGPADARAVAASLYAYGTGEAAAAQAGLALDEQASRSREVQRQAEAAQREAASDRIAEMRSQATAQMWQGIIQGVGQMAQGACTAGAGFAGSAELDTSGSETAASAASSSKFSGAGQGLNGIATGAAAFVGADAAEHGARAEEARQRESMNQSQVQALSEDVERAQRLMDKAFGHIDQIAQARMDARLASSRG